ncbi:MULTISPECIES: alpha/beta fold hydrolase [unclassified Gordonia (in: high G+C Gram-positive bacteria)]|uniref:alpha/beta fold hydrolase n=1 Tax=unclassified Gordonia (in: high G+C Gram-positive bacteria) TaxID=2657482 RepID=UPI001F0DC422|nr:alpha/beta hydrolase [Gordonia sp. ABSL49_1]MCH5645497.1 alpha/beta hydrolase [Gordonia sp. ABSL49_1]
MRILTRTTGPDLAVRVSGDLDSRRAVLLVHGMAGDHSTWRSTARRLRAVSRPVISVDLRGHGRSGRGDRPYRLDDLRDDLDFVLDELGLDTVDAVGHSLGAHSLLRLAMTRPERVSRLVLEEVPPMPRDQADVDEQITVSARFGEHVRGLVSLVQNPYPVLRFDRRMAETVASEFEVSAPQWWAKLERVTAPTLVISGGPQSFLPPRHLATLAEALPDGRFVRIDTGHSVHRDKSREFIDAAVGFLDDR